MTILLIGSGAREHAIARAIRRSPQTPDLVSVGSSVNPGIKELCAKYTVGDITDAQAVAALAQEHKADIAVIGPEAPLEAGVANALWDAGVPCVGPKKTLAQIETSKSFARELLRHANLPGLPKYKVFSTMDDVQEFLAVFDDNYVIKADGLMGGKGVKVAGDHLHSHDEALAYCQELVDSGSSFVIEEKFVGEEFSLMSFCDGEHLAHMPPAQDHKRAYVKDTGPNTGGMGSYSDANHLLPFVTKDDILAAQEMNRQTAEALRAECGEGFKGILYGGFMATANGIKLIEYNARFGDPEVMNALPILESDFVALCQAIVLGTLTQDHARFAPTATVCKYVVPVGYPDNPIKDQPIDVSEVQNPNRLYYAAVDAREDELVETGSRAVAVVGIGRTIREAERMAEDEVNRVSGPLFHREDIGTDSLVQKRVEHMNTLRKDA